jgi:hypothetical protein
MARKSKGDHGGCAHSRGMRCLRDAEHPDVGRTASTQAGGLHEHWDGDVLLKAREQRARCSILQEERDSSAVVACRMLSSVGAAEVHAPKVFSCNTAIYNASPISSARDS